YFPSLFFPSSKTSSDYFNNLFLLLHRHLIITRQAQTSFKDIHTNIQATAVNVSVGSSSTIAITNQKRIHAINRLHMHRLPDRTTFCIDVGDSFQNLSRTALSMFSNIEGFLLPSDLLA